MALSEYPLNERNTMSKNKSYDVTYEVQPLSSKDVAKQTLTATFAATLGSVAAMAAIGAVGVAAGWVIDKVQSRRINKDNETPNTEE